MRRCFSRKKILQNLAALLLLSLWGLAVFPVFAQDESARATSASAPAANAPTAKNPSPDQGISEALNSLEAKRLEIQKEKQQLNVQKAQLEALKQELDTKIDNLTRLQKQVEADLKKRDALKTQAQNQKKVEQEAKMKQLVRVYTSMKPKTAAALIDKLDMNVVLKIFARMNGAQVARILSYVDRNRAALISERLAQQPPAK